MKGLLAISLLSVAEFLACSGNAAACELRFEVRPVPGNYVMRLAYTDEPVLEISVSADESTCADETETFSERDYSFIAFSLNTWRYQVDAFQEGVSLCKRRSTWAIRNLLYAWCIGPGQWDETKVRQWLLVSKSVLR